MCGLQYHLLLHSMHPVVTCHPHPMPQVVTMDATSQLGTRITVTYFSQGCSVVVDNATSEAGPTHTWRGARVLREVASMALHVRA